MNSYTIRSVSAGLMLICSCTVGGEPKAPKSVTPEIRMDIPSPIYVSPIRRDNCDVWVEIEYEGAKDIVNQNLNFIDPKPGEGDERQATEQLLRVLSGEGHGRNSRIFTYYAKGKVKHKFTYFRGCNGLPDQPAKPNK